MIQTSNFDEFEYVHGAAGIETLDTLRQRLAYDIVPNEVLDEFPTRLGLNAASPEVQRAEHAASRARRAATAPLVPMLLDLSRLSSEVIAEAILVRHPESDEESESSISPNEVFASTNAILATLIDMGLVHLPHPTGDLT